MKTTSKATKQGASWTVEEKVHCSGGEACMVTLLRNSWRAFSTHLPRLESRRNGRRLRARLAAEQEIQRRTAGDLPDDLLSNNCGK